jgi:PAS domain S-box-containing protein
MTLLAEPATPLVDAELPILWTAFEHAPIGVAVCDQDGVVVLANDCLLRLARRLGRDAIGRPFLSFVHPDERATVLASYLRSLVAATVTQHTGPTEHAEVRCLGVDGRVVWLQVAWTITPPDRDGRQFAVLHVSDVGGLTRR